jgi:hypothetical protein
MPLEDLQQTCKIYNVMVEVGLEDLQRDWKVSSQLGNSLTMLEYLQ